MNIRRYRRVIVSILFITMGMSIFPAFAKNGWWSYGSSPIEILETVKTNTNDDAGYEIQDTALDKAMNEVSPSSEHRIYATLTAVRQHINVYLQWMMYIGLSLATILLIANGFMMVTHGVHKSWDFSALKKNVSKIVIGVLIMTGFRAIMKLLLAVMNMLFVVE